MSHFSGNYIDSSRNIAVNLDSRELKMTLKKIKQDEDGVFDNTGIVNSQWRVSLKSWRKPRSVYKAKDDTFNLNIFYFCQIIDKSAWPPIALYDH